MKAKLIAGIAGFLGGIVNGLLGTGGGMILVPLFKVSGLESKLCHATSLAVTLPITVFSAVLYFMRGSMPLSGIWVLVPLSAAGAVLGAWFLKKINTGLLNRLFALLLILAGVRQVFFR